MRTILYVKVDVTHMSSETLKKTLMKSALLAATDDVPFCGGEHGKLFRSSEAEGKNFTTPVGTWHTEEEESL